MPSRSPSRFPTRTAAGSLLAEALLPQVHHPIILALPRGGVAVARAIADRFGVPVYPFIVRKLAAPDQPEFALGAIAENGGIVVDSISLADAGLSAAEMEEILERERAELLRRQARYTVPGRPRFTRRQVVVVDDGMATGYTMIAALRAVARDHPARLIAAVPVASPQACRLVLAEKAECICLVSPAHLHSVGSWYDQFPQLTDDEVTALLQKDLTSDT